jgi:L-ribulose-5-phosphate 3-epimerase
MTQPNNLRIGFIARLFPSNWRPVLQEIDFAAANGFTAIQFLVREKRLSAEHLGAEFAVVRRALEQAGITAVMEIMVHVDSRGYSSAGETPVELLVGNLPAIKGLNCRRVHFHFAPQATLAAEMMPEVEKLLLPSLDTATGLAAEWGFRFGLEHNERAVGLFTSPQSITNAQQMIPKLGFVWDINHTHPDDLEAFSALLPHVSMLHISDTRLPETNEHLPLGMGTVDFAGYCQRLHAHGFSGPAILEIGGITKSGGFGRDTDEALIDSLRRFQSIYSASQ